MRKEKQMKDLKNPNLLEKKPNLIVCSNHRLSEPSQKLVWNSAEGTAVCSKNGNYKKGAERRSFPLKLDAVDRMPEPVWLAIPLFKKLCKLHDRYEAMSDKLKLKKARLMKAFFNTQKKLNKLGWDVV